LKNNSHPLPNNEVEEKTYYFWGFTSWSLVDIYTKVCKVPDASISTQKKEAAGSYETVQTVYT
jgi:hypothetical protein